LSIIFLTTSSIVPSLASTIATTLFSHFKSAGVPTREYALFFNSSINLLTASDEAPAPV